MVRSLFYFQPLIYIQKPFFFWEGRTLCNFLWIMKIFSKDLFTASGDCTDLIQLIHPGTPWNSGRSTEAVLTQCLRYSGSRCCVWEFIAAVLSSTAIKLPCSVQSSQTVASFSMAVFSHLYNMYSNISICKGLLKNHLSIKGFFIKLADGEMKGCIFH